MGRLKKKEREIPLSLFYLKYFLYLFIGVVLIGILAIFAFSGLGASDIIHPADFAQEQAKSACDRILKTDKVSEDMIPDLCQYIVFDIDGRVKSGNIEKTGINSAWAAVQGSTSDFSGNYYKVIQRENEYCVLRYKITPQYKSETLRKYLLSPQTLFIVAVLLLTLLIVAGTAIRFGNMLKKKLHSLIFAAEKIQNQELEFSIEPSNIKEVNMVLTSMDNMRVALKSSLESQWKMEQSRREQISALAHDLKTPLTLIRGNTELLYDTEPTAEQTECIGYIEESSLQMQNYVQMLIEIAKSNNSLSPQLQDIDISSFMQDIQKQAKGLCAVKNIQLCWETNYGSQRFSIDPNLLVRALSNVLSNAVEHTPSGGTVTFMTVEENGCMMFSIIDTGKGFSAEALKYAATQFYMDDRSRNSKSHFGIGLFVADSVAKQHGGRLILENDMNTQGAKVTIEIPL
jgi:two-component system, OmpR family, lantibiotic biosynthesis sensor histidine kinase NisK/SpaK